MNQLIKELAEQCYEKHPLLDTFQFNQEKFAELIVKECASYVDEAISGGGVDGRGLKEHFGVES